MDDTGTTPKPRPAPRARISPPEVKIYPSPDDVAWAAARQFVEIAWQAVAATGTFYVALAGGNTPRSMYRVLASQDFRGQVDWKRVQVFWGDERAVPPDDPESNYGMARRELLLHVPVPPGNIHRMEAERPDLGRAAQDYEDTLRRFLPLSARGFPRFDLILLGVGPEGHTASLFPDSPNLNETSRWVTTPLVPKLNSRRMTLTLPVLNAAHFVLFSACGSEKAAVLRAILQSTPDPPLPAQMVTVPEGSRLFLVDVAAGSMLDDRWKYSAARGLNPEGSR